MKTVNIHGRPYVTVSERLAHFRTCGDYDGWAIRTEIIFNQDSVCVFRAEVADLDDRVIATGHAREREGDSQINKTSYLENCETSAVGRALGTMGIGIDGSIASAEEVQTAIINQDRPTEAARPATNLKESTPRPEFTQHAQNKSIFKGVLKKKIAACKLRVNLTDKGAMTAILLKICDDPAVLKMCLNNELDAPAGVMADDQAQWQIMAEAIKNMPVADFERLIAQPKEF